MKKKRQFIKGINSYDFYPLPTLYFYSRHKDSYTIELCIFKFYIGIKVDSYTFS